jgi:single-strand DNA-binding protein
MNETMVTVVGNVISDVHKRDTQAGVPLATFRMVSNERRFDKVTGQWIDGDRLYLSVTCWRRLALGVLTSLEKGDPVVVRGRLFTRNYEIEGHRRTVTELEAYQLGPDLSRCHVCVQRSGKPGPSAPPPKAADASFPCPRQPEDATADGQTGAGKAGRSELSLVGGASDN